MSDLSIIIRAILEKSTKQQIEQELKIIEQKLKPLEIKIDKKVLDVLQLIVEANKKFGTGVEQSTNKLNEQTKQIQQEKLEINKLSNAYDELGKKIKTVQTLDANKTPITRTETYKNLAGVETTVRTAGSKETGYTVVTKDKSLQQEQLELEKHIGDIQNKNFNEAKEHLTKIGKLRERYYQLNNRETEEAKELTKQMTYHQGQYNNIIRRKIDIGDKTKIEGIEAEKLIQLEKIREQTLRNIGTIKSKNIDKDIIQQQKLTSQIHKQSLAQQDLLNRIRGMRGIDGKYIVGDNLSSLNQLETQILGFDPTNKNFSKNMADANSKLKEISTTTSIYKKEIQDANKFTGVFGQSLLEAGKKFASWLLIGDVIIKSITAVKNGIQSIIDIDTALTNLNKVTDETRETLNKFSLEANAIGRNLAKTSVEVINSTTEFARLGYSLEQSAQLAKQALLYSNVGDIGVEEASLAIISAVKGFGVAVDEEGRNIQKIVDIYNEVGNNFAISSAGIGEAMRRSAASLYSAGNTMEEAVALITAANAVVQDPAMVGTALKTISMRLRGVSEDGEDVLEYLPKLEESFKNIGIQIRKDENTFKSTYDIMLELALVWEKLTDVQRANMSELVAGKRQGNIVMAMMTNYKDMQDSLTTALNSTNSALIENEKYMESIEAKSAQFKNTVMGKWQEALNSDVIKNFVVAMTTLVEVLGNTNTILAISTTAFLLFKGQAVLGSILALTSFIATETMATVSTTALTGSVGLLTTAFNALKIAITTNPLGALAVGITTIIVGFQAYTNHVKKAREETEKFIATIQSDIQNLKSQKEGLQELTSEYETLKDKEKNLTATIEEKKRLLEIQKELVNKYNVSATGINLEGEAYANSTEAIKLRTLALEEEITKEKEKLKLNILSADALNTEDIRSNTKSRDKAQKKIETAIKVLPYLEENDPYAANLKKEQIKQFEKDIEEANLIIQETSKNRRKYLEYEAQETIKTLESNGKEMSDSAKLVVSEFAKSLALEPENIETQQQALQDFINKVSDSNLDVLIEQYNKFVSAINSGDNSKDNVNGLEKTSASITKLINSWTKGNPILKEFAINFASLYPPTINAKNAIDSFNNSLKEIDFKTITDQIKFLHKALQELSSKDGLSSSSKEKIIEEYPQLFAYMNDEIELRNQLQTIIEESEQQQIDAFLNTKDANGKTRKQMLEIDESYFNNVIKSNADFLRIVNEAGIKSIKDFKTIADAKEAIESATIGRMSKLWTKYYGATDPTQDKELYRHISSMAMFGSANDPRTQLAKDTLSAVSVRNKAIKELNELINQDVGSKLGSINLGDIKSSSKANKYISDQYAISVAKLDQELKSLSYTKSKLSQTSEEYRNILLQEISIDQQKQQLAHSEADRLRVLRSQVKEGTKEYDDYTKSIQSLGETYIDLQKSIDDTSTQLEDIILKLNDLKYESYNNILEASENKLSKFHELSSEYSSEISHQISLRQQEQQSILDEISALEKLIQTEEIETLKRQKHIDRIKFLASQYWELERAIDSNKKALEEIDFKKFENSLSQLERALEPLNNKISNLKSNLDLLSDTNFDGKINLITQQMIANKDLVSQLEEQLRQLLSTTPKNAKEAQALAQSIKNTKSALFAARKETILYGKELGKLALEKIKYGFDKVTNSLEQQMNITEHLIDMMIDGIPTGIDLNFEYATNIKDVDITEDAENLAQAGIDVFAEFYADSLEAQRDYNAEIIEEQREFFSEQTQQFQNFFDNFLKMVAEMNGVHIFDTTLSDFAKVQGASEETIKKLQELEKKIQQLENNKIKNTKKNTDKVVDINQDGIDDITGEWISGYEDNLQETRNYFRDLIDEYGTNWDKIISLVQGKIKTIESATPNIPNTSNNSNNNNSNNGSNNSNNTSSKTLVRTITPANFINENGTTYMQKSNFPSDVQAGINSNTQVIYRDNYPYYSIRAAYESAGYSVEWDGNNVLIYKYAKGTKGHPGGSAIISEEGNELLIFPNGQISVSGNKGAEFISDLPKGTQVIPHKETEDILKNRSYANGIFNEDIQKVLLDYFIKENPWASPYRDQISSNFQDDWEGVIMSAWYDGGTQYINGNAMAGNSNIAKYEFLYDPTDGNWYLAHIDSYSGKRVFNSESNEYGDYEETKVNEDTWIKIPDSNPNTNRTASASNIPLIDFVASGITPEISTKKQNDSYINALYGDKDGGLLGQNYENVQNLRNKVSSLLAISKMSEGQTYKDTSGLDVTVTADIINQASKDAIEATKSLMSAEKKLKQVIKDKYNYEFSALEKQHGGLNDTIALEDDIKDKISLLDEDDFARRTNLTDQLLGNAQQRKQALQDLIKIAEKERDLYPEGTEEWTVINDKIKGYDEQLEDVEIDLKNINEQIESIRLDNVTQQIDDMTEAMEKLSQTTSGLQGKLDLLKTWKPNDWAGQSSLIDQIIGSNDNELNSLRSNIDFFLNKRNNATGEDEWNLWNEQLESAYAHEQDLIQQNANLRKEQLQTEFNQQYEQIEKLVFNGQTQDEAQEALNKLKEEQQDYIHGQEKQLALDNLKDQLRKDEITDFNTIISQYEQKDKLSRDDLDRLQKQVAIKELEIKLQNQLNDKTIQTLKQQSDGSWQYEYSVDQNAVDETNRQLREAKIDLINFDEETTLNSQQKELDNRSKFLSEVKKIQDKALNGQYASQAEFVADMQKLGVKLGTDYSGTWASIVKQQLIDEGKLTGSFSTMESSYNTFVTNMTTYSNALSNSITSTAASATTAVQSLIDAQNRLIAAQSAAQSASQTSAYNAAQTRANSTYEEQIAEMETNNANGNIPTVNNYKVWTVTYSGATDTSDAVVVDSSGNIVPITVSKMDDDSFAVTPSTAYTTGETYTLTVGSTVQKFKVDPSGKFEEGGMTPDFTGGKLAMLHGKELVLNKVDTSNLLKAIDLTRNLVGNIKVPDFSSLKSKVENTTSQVFNIAKLEFPNVTSADGLQEAILNLPRLALQMK